MAWVNWSRRSTASRDGGNLGMELNASRARAALGSVGHHRVVLLEEPHPDLPLAISLEHRAPEVGRRGIALQRRLPHLVCSGFLPALGQPQEWKGGRHRLNAAEALGIAFGRIQNACQDFGSIYLGLPAYFTHNQVAKLKVVAARHQLPIRGTVGSALALATDRAAALLAQPSGKTDLREDGIVPMHRPGQVPLPADVMVIDADDEMLTGSLLRIEPSQVILLGTSVLPRVGVKHWKDKLLDSLSDRCVRACRRDPRDSAESEQALFQQLDECLDPIRSGRPVTLTVRAAHWYQDLHIRPEDLTACCAALIRQSVDGIRELQNAGSPSEPPRAVWMTHEAGRLPGLAQALYQNMAERTSVGVLRPEAVAIAVANLAERWPASEHVHWTVPISVKPPDAKLRIPVAKSQR